MRIRAIYAVDNAIMKQSPSRRTALREEKVLPLMDAFFAWEKLKFNSSRDATLPAQHWDILLTQS